jgi:hypothetical protein
MKKCGAAFICILFLMVLGCSKAKGPANAKSAQQNNNRDSTVTMYATINGEQWKTDSAFGYNVQFSGNDTGIIDLLITATLHEPTLNSTIRFTISNFSGPNIYPVNPPYVTASYYRGSTRYFATSGQIIITTAVNPYALTGNFDFVADSITVTDGYFDVAKP